MAFKYLEVLKIMYLQKKKIKDFIGYGGLHRLYTSIYMTSKYLFLLCLLFLDEVMENIFFNIISIF